MKAKVIKNIAVGEKYYKILLHCPNIASQAAPGQFVQVKVCDGLEPLLRRPFSISKVISHKSQVISEIEIIYEVVGEGSRLLSRKKPGELLDVIGPLGNGFDFASCVMRHASCVLVAGGMGVAPIMFLAEKLVISHKSQVTSKIMVLIGAKTKSQLLCVEEFRKLGCEVKISTDNGSAGFRGYVSNLLSSLLMTYDLKLTTLYACGPTPMLKAVSALSKQYNIPAQVSLEAHLACGIGACLGCVVNTRDGYQRVCQEGPVFRAEEIVWESREEMVL